MKQSVIDSISESVLCLTNYENTVIGTVIIWDTTETDVFILTNSHTWGDFPKYFPPNSTKKKKKKVADEDNEILKLWQNDKHIHSFSLSSNLFTTWDEAHDFAILKFRKTEKLSMPRIPISLNINLTLKVHAFGFIGHSQKFNITGGEIASKIPQGFTMNMLSAPGYSGAAIVADYYGRAVGYMGGNLDASEAKNSQHQSYAYTFDIIVEATKRVNSPQISPSVTKK